MKDRLVSGNIFYEWAGTGDRRWLHPDAHGSIMARTDATGHSPERYAYGPYGEPQTVAGARFRYTGQIMIPEGSVSDAALYYYKSRFYDTKNGRFLQTDSIGYQSDMDSYAYVGNDPINRSDTLGLFSCQDPRHEGPCPPIAQASLPVLSKLVAGVNRMSTLPNIREAGVAVTIDANSGAVSNVYEGRAAGHNDRENPMQFDFDFPLNPGDADGKGRENTGGTGHDHPKQTSESRDLGTRQKVREVNTRNEYPSSGDLMTMDKSNRGQGAPIVVRTPSGAIREVYRGKDGYDHMLTIREGSVPLGPIPRDIADHFILDPNP